MNKNKLRFKPRIISRRLATRNRNIFKDPVLDDSAKNSLLYKFEEILVGILSLAKNLVFTIFRGPFLLYNAEPLKNINSRQAQGMILSWPMLIISAATLFFAYSPLFLQIHISPAEWVSAGLDAKFDFKYFERFLPCVIVGIAFCKFCEYIASRRLEKTSRKEIFLYAALIYFLSILSLVFLVIIRVTIVELFPLDLLVLAFPLSEYFIGALIFIPTALVSLGCCISLLHIYYGRSRHGRTNKTTLRGIFLAILLSVAGFYIPSCLQDLTLGVSHSLELIASQVRKPVEPTAEFVPRQLTCFTSSGKGNQSLRCIFFVETKGSGDVLLDFSESSFVISKDQIGLGPLETLRLDVSNALPRVYNNPRLTEARISYFDKSAIDLKIVSPSVADNPIATVSLGSLLIVQIDFSSLVQCKIFPLNFDGFDYIYLKVRPIRRKGYAAEFSTLGPWRRPSEALLNSGCV